MTKVRGAKPVGKVANIKSSTWRVPQEPPDFAGAFGPPVDELGQAVDAL